MASELNQNSLNTLKKHLEAGEFANAEDMNVLKKLIDYEVNWRRHQNYSLTTEIAQPNKQFDTAKYINNLIGGLRKIHKQKFQLVTQNITFINAIFDIVRKLEVLMSYKEHTQYLDNAGCDGECRGLCSSCAMGCVGGNDCNFRQYSGSGGGSYIQEYSSGGCSTNCTAKFSCITQSSSCPHQCPGYTTNGRVYVYGQVLGFTTGKAVELTSSSLTKFVRADGTIVSTVSAGVDDNIGYFSDKDKAMIVKTGGTTYVNAAGVYVTNFVGGGFAYGLNQTGGTCGQSSVQAKAGYNPGAYNGGCGPKNWSW